MELCYSDSSTWAVSVAPGCLLSGRSAAWLARLVRDQEAGGSNPLAPTILFNQIPGTPYLFSIRLLVRMPAVKPFKFHQIQGFYGFWGGWSSCLSGRSKPEVPEG